MYHGKISEASCLSKEVRKKNICFHSRTGRANLLYGIRLAAGRTGGWDCLGRSTRELSKCQYLLSCLQCGLHGYVHVPVFIIYDLCLSFYINYTSLKRSILEVSQNKKKKNQISRWLKMPWSSNFWSSGDSHKDLVENHLALTQLSHHT